MLDRFFDYLQYELNRAPLTIDAYKTDISQFQEWLAPGKPESVDFSSVTSSDIRAWLAARGRQGDIPRTLRRKIISLRTLYKWMMKTGQIKQSPLQNVPLPKIPKPLPNFIKPSEIENTLQQLEAPKGENPGRNLSETNVLEALVVEMLYTLGIRRAELIGINDSDISFSKGEIRVTGKRSKQRVIPVPELLLSKIRKWQECRDKEIKDSKCDTNTQAEDGPLFVVKGKRIRPDQVYKIVHNALATSSARKKSPHALRHSFASGMLNGGADLDSVREFLGHTSLATTQIYTHISLKEIKKAYAYAHPRSNAQEIKAGSEKGEKSPESL